MSLCRFSQIIPTHLLCQMQTYPKKYLPIFPSQNHLHGKFQIHKKYLIIRVTQSHFYGFRCNLRSVHTRRQVAATRHVAVTNRFVCTREFLDFLQQNFVAATSCKKSNQTVFCVTCRGDKILLQIQRFSQNFSSTLEAICCCEVSPQHVAATCNCCRICTWTQTRSDLSQSLQLVCSTLACQQALLARAFSRGSLRLPKQESLLAGQQYPDSHPRWGFLSSWSRDMSHSY